MRTCDKTKPGFWILDIDRNVKFWFADSGYGPDFWFAGWKALHGLKYVPLAAAKEGWTPYLDLPLVTRVTRS